MILAPEGDLPQATVNGRQVAFTRNGAVVVAEKGHWVFDIGLNYMTDGWAEWGTQIRRSALSDSWSLDETRGRCLVTHGTLFDVKDIPRFKFVQRTEVVPGGLRLTYEVTPLEERPLSGFGLVMHLPISETAKGQVSLWTDFRPCTLPETKASALLCRSTSRAAILYVSGKPRAAVISDRDMTWDVLDDRAWNLNTFRLVAQNPLAVSALKDGKTASFSFELLLGDSAVRRYPFGPGQLETDRYGRTALQSKQSGKLLEGGPAQLGQSVKWLWGSDKAADDPVAAATADAGKVSGASNVGRKEAAREFHLDQEGDSFLATYRLHPTAAGKPVEKVGVAFAVPAPQVTGTPVAARKGRTSGAETAPTAEDKAEYVVTISYQGGLGAELTASEPWEVSRMTFNKVECFLLSANATDAGAGSREVRIKFRVIEVKKPGETRP